MDVTLDPTLDLFLVDHVVHGVPLLPTVMGLDLLARAVLTGLGGMEHPEATLVEIRDVVVGPPVLVPEAGRRTVTVEVGAPVVDGPNLIVAARLVDANEPAGAHYSGAVVVTTAPTAALASSRHPAQDRALTLRPGDVYPPYFHGPAFQVVGGAVAHDDGVRARLAEPLPELRWADRRTVTAPALLELCLQSCGLLELADTGRMMIPDGIDRVRSWPDAIGPGPIEAFVRPRTGSSDARTTFDGRVVGPDGQVLLSMEGYRTVDLGQVVDPAVSDRVRAGLGLGARVAP